MDILHWLVGVAHAQFGGGNRPTIQSFDFLGGLIGINDPEGGINRVIGGAVGLVLLLAAIVAFVYFIIAGFQYMTAGGDAAKAQAARQHIINSIIGIVIILLSYAILRFIFQRLLN